MPDLNKSIRKDMKKKPSGKFSSIKLHYFGFTVIFIILLGKTDSLTVKRDNPGVADCYPVSITTKITNYMPRRLERFSAKNHPFKAVYTIDKFLEVVFKG
jgi:hypothetical protein